MTCPVSSKLGRTGSPHTCFSGRPLKLKALPPPPGHLTASAQRRPLPPTCAAGDEMPGHSCQAGEGVRSMASYRERVLSSRPAQLLPKHYALGPHGGFTCNVPATHLLPNIPATRAWPAGPPNSLYLVCIGSCGPSELRAAWLILGVRG